MWGYWPHCWSLSVLVLMTAGAAPLVYDWTLVYKYSLDSGVFAAICTTIGHLFLWILAWMALTIKVIINVSCLGLCGRDICPKSYASYGLGTLNP